MIIFWKTNFTKTSRRLAIYSLEHLQFLIVDSLEDVKGQNILVFDTSHKGSLFDRVIIASGISNRQTRALAHSVIKNLKKKLGLRCRIEGEDNAEWVLVDCGDIICHVMQPIIRDYYKLEEIWGDVEIPVESVKKFNQIKRQKN